jgi:chromosome segregation protein
MLLFRRWSEADTAMLAAVAQLRARTTAAGAAETAARQAAKARLVADDALPALREEGAIAAAVLQRLQVQRDALKDQETRALETIETLRTRIDQLGRDMDREGGLNKDAGETIDRLDWEAREIAKASEGHDTRLEAAHVAARAAGGGLEARESDLSQLTEDVARLAARHQSAQRLLTDTGTTVTRSETDAAKAKAAMAQADKALKTAQADFTAASAAETQAVATAEAADITLAKAEAARAETQIRESDARAKRAEAEGEANALRAEVAALARLVERDTAEGGQVLDLLQVDRGYEKALGAALADDLRAPAIGPDAASGWATLHPYLTAQALPDGVAPLTEFVVVPDVLGRRMTQVGLVRREEGAQLQAVLKPGQRLVSREGDVWRWDGFRAASEDAPSAAALRLQQLNRLVELKRDFEEINAIARGAAQAHDTLTRSLAELSAADQAARQARRDADSLVAQANRAASRAEADRNLSQGKLESSSLAVTRHEDDAAIARRALIDAERAVADLGDLGDARAQVEGIKLTVEAARTTMMSCRSALDEVRREGTARLRRSQEITKEMSGWKHRLETANKRSADLADRKDVSEAALRAATAAPEEIATKRSELAVAIDAADVRRRASSDKLALAETALRGAADAEREAERGASEARESRARSEARADAARETVASAQNRIIEAQEVTPAQLLESLATDLDQMPAAEIVEGQVNALKRQRDSLGAVNLRAEEDSQEVQTEHDHLVSEKADLEAAISALRHGIASLNKEGRERLLTAFEQVNENFGLLFSHLFGGGEAKLVLVESDDPLEAGLEIMCQPPGKKLSTLSLLSGGEQTLTALALIFAVFLANPAPICVLDEVDAPLDDANVTRFCDLLDEMTRRTQTRFLIITHHAVTMSRMDRLFGVTMGEQGVSQLVAVDLKNAAAMVA